jgi:hypothetical protein
MSAGNERAKNIVFAGLVATTAAATGGVAVVSALTPAGAATATTTGSILLGESMNRVQPAANKLGALTFRMDWTDEADVMAKNMAWLQQQIASGTRIFDIGLDPGRLGRGPFYAAEAKMMQAAGYVRQYVREVRVGEVAHQLYEWVRPAAEMNK